MPLYAGSDLHGNNSYWGIIDPYTAPGGTLKTIRPSAITPTVLDLGYPGSALDRPFL